MRTTIMHARYAHIHSLVAAWLMVTAVTWLAPAQASAQVLVKMATLVPEG